MTVANTASLHAADTWIFDLDNTLYPAKCDLFAQIDVKMGQFIGQLLNLPYDDARKVQKDYFKRYGTTLNGLMHEHEMKPTDFLDFVHDIDYSILSADDRLRQSLSKLDAKRVIFTNGTVKHAESVLEKLGIIDLFDDIFDIVSSNYVPKPNEAPYRDMIKRMNIDASNAVMVEDMAKNLTVPAQLGMTTVWIKTKEDWSSDGAVMDHIHHQTDDLSDWLANILANRM